MLCATKSEVLDRLRGEIRRIERRPSLRPDWRASGLAEVDALLPGGGFPCGALTELAGGPASGKTALALAALGRATREGALAAWVDGRRELYPPAAAALGVDLARLLVVRRPKASTIDLLWAAEALLASGAFAAVAVDVPTAGLRPAQWDQVSRRLVQAADKGGALALWLSMPGEARAPAAARVEVEPPGRDGLSRVRVTQARGMAAVGAAVRVRLAVAEEAAQAA